MWRISGKGQLVNLRIFYNKKYCTAPGRGIENVLFKDISYTGDRAEVSVIEGYNEERKIKRHPFREPPRQRAVDNGRHVR